MHSERIFKVQIPDELKDNYKSGLPAFREPKLEAGENQHNHRVQGETVAGTLHESGLFVYTLSSGYIPVFLENVQVLVELEKFLVDSPTRSESRGLHYKKEPDGDKVPNKVVKWGSFVYGMVVAENTNWVQVGEYYLPIEWNGHQVLYPAESWNAAPKSFAPDQTARLCLFAPHEGDYFVTGTFTKSWKTAWDLTPEPFSESRAKGFRGRIYYVDVPVQELNNAEFKFQFHEKGTWKQVTDFLYITEKLKWEYDSLNNRTVKLDGRVAPGSKLFMYWGFPEASEQHVMEFLKVVLSGPGLNGLDEAMRRVDEVRQSVRQVTCKWPTARRTSVEQFDRLIPLALRDVLDSRPPAGPQPCSGVFVWMAVLEQRTRGNLSMLHHIRPEVVSVVAKWPPDIMSDARLAGCVHAAAKSALREEARNTSRKLSGQWLQAAIQVILHSETSIAEIPGAELVERGVVPQWAEIRLKDAPQARIESALRIAFKPAHTLQEVFDAAKAFLDHADRRAWGPLCVQTALEEGLAWVERSMDWGAGANNLQRLLDCLDDARVDEKNLVDIIQKAWRRLGARPHIIPEPTGHLNQSTRIVSQALTAEPEDADFVEFEGSSAFSWLRLAVLASNYSVTNDRWVASIAHFAARLCGQTKVAASFIKQAIKVLYSLRGSAVLQRATFERLWSFQRQLDATSILQTFGDEFQEEACLAFSVLQLHHSLHQMEEIRDMRTRAEQWHHLLVQADEHKHGNFVEVVLCFVVSRVCLVSDESSIAPAPELARLQDAWGGPGLKEERLGPVRMSWILLSPELWRQVIAIAKRPNQSNIGQIQSALRESLQSLRASILSEELTVQDMLTPKLAAWEGRNFIDLLEQEKIPEGQVRPKLEQMINKLHFMQKFERAVLSDLPQLLPRARQFAKQLHLLFLKASTGQPSITSTNVFGLEVSLARINDSAWVEEFEDEWLQLTVADVPQASFSSVLAAIETLHFARSQQNPPMQLMLQEVEQDLKSTGEELNVLDNIFFLHRGVTRLLKDLSGLRGEEAGLPSEILSSIERHWAGVAPQDVDRFLQGIQSVTSVFQGQGGLNEVSRRLQAVLAARQTVEFANHCTLILRHLSSKVKVPNKGLTEGFSLDTRSHMASLREMQEAFNAAKNKKSESNLTTKALDKVDHATQCLRQMFDFLGARGSGFELVLRLVTALAQVPGLSFLTVLLSSAQKGEHLAMRLAELVEGALTQETLAHVEQASAVFMPLCVASLAAMNMPVDANKFGAMVQGVWSKRIQREALGAWCEAAIGDLMLNMLQEAHANHRSNLRDFSDSLRSALRQGQVLQQKLEENSDDATAVSNTVHGMVSAGHLELTPSADGTHFEVVGVFEFSKDPVSRDVQQLTECSDKASLAVPKGTADADNPTALTQEKVQIFTGCVEGILGLRQELTELLQIGHPYLEDAGQLRFPRQGEGLSASTLQDLKDTLRWAQGAMQQWCNALDQARARHAIMSAIPARNITKLARAVLQNETRAVAPLMSLHFQTGTSFHKDQELEYALEKCKFLEPRERAHERFMDKLVEVLTAQVIPENTMTRFLPLHEVARNYPKKRACDDTTTRSRMERRQNPKFYPKRVLLIQEELSHESGNLALQSTATTTVLSLLLPLGIGPSAENLLLCDSSTTKDDILRFLHRVTHATRLAMDTSRQSQVLGVCVHVDCLQPDVLQELLCRVDAMQAAVGRRKEADSTAEIEVRLAFTLTARASKMLIETLEKDLCKQQQINVLKLSSIKAFLKEAGEERKAEGRTALGWHQVVTSEYAGDGKTHAIRRSEKWDPDSHVSVIWGGAQTRGQAARALRKAEGAGSVHLELHGFEEGGGVDADMLLMELLLFRCVFDPERSEWTRLAVETPLFVEVANSIKIKQGQRPAQLMLLSAPILEGVPGQNEIHADSPFLFDGNDLHPEVASSIAQDFALAGAALFLNDDRPHLVGCEDDAVFKLVASSQGQELVLAGDHANLLQRYSVDVDEAAKLALQEAWLHGVGAKADRDPPVPSKATIMSFLRFLAHWTRNWALHLHHYEQAFHGERGVNIPGTFLQVLKEMIPMAAAMCLRSSAAEAQMEQRERTVAENGEAASLSEAMACRVLDPRTSASRVWAFNTGGSLRFIGNRTELPSALQHLWDIVRRYTREPIVPPPINLGNAEQLELRELLLDVMRGHNLTDKELEDAFRGFVLTQDNMIKLVDVAERLRAHLPCILMGEAGCGKTVLLRLTTRLLGAGELDEQQVHAGTTEADILEALSRAEELARKKEESKKDGGTEHMVVQFWDELNTCPHQPLFKQILVDRVNPSTNQPIHKGLRFVAACNPWRRASQGSVVCAGFESPVAQDDRLAGLAYRVHPLPESLFTHLSSFGQLDLDTEQQYVKEMASQHPQLLNPDDQWLIPDPLTKSMCDHAARYVCIIHKFFRDFGSCVSLRDPNRLLKLWGFIRWELKQREKLNMPKGSLTRHLSSDASKGEVKSLVLAIHLAYEIRLPDLEKRNELLATLFDGSNLGSLFQKYFPETCSDELERIETWRGIVEQEQDYWLEAIDVADNIAKIRALRENIYATLICSMTRTPIFILGKPGCSKSLTVSLLISALADPYKDQLLHLASFSVQPYQGSRQSTSSSLLAVFERALARQKKLRTLNRRTRPLALVLLDEVGLAEQSPHNPLKVLHARLEPRRAQDAVSVIAISNWELDRSKLSRGLLLACPPPSESDLSQTALAIIRAYLAHESQIRGQLEASLGHMATAFMEILKNQEPQDFHGLRDWYGMCSFAARLLLAADVEMGFGSEEVKHGALMHAVSHALRKEAVQLVKLCRERELQFVPADWALKMAVLNNVSGNHSSGALHKMLHSLSQEEKQDSYQSISALEQIYPEVLQVSNRLDSLLGDVDGRHIMVITDSPGPVIAWIQHRARQIATWNPESLVGSPLEQDQASTDMYAQSMIQAAIVSMAQERRLLVLQNLDIIYAALYDVFNSNYSRASGPNSQRYCRIAREGFCNPRCAVADQFKAVLVVTRERAARYEPALLNRFAKLEDIVDYLRFQLEWCAGELFGLLHEKPGLLTQSALHVLAVVAHGVRGDDGSRSIRPFLLAGPVTERTDASPDVKMFQWTGIAVDHFSHLLPWGMRPEELLNGTIKEIFGLQDESPDRFRRILADALPHVVPRFGSEHHHADSFVIIQSLMREINSKPELVSGIRSVLAEQLSLEEADWRMDVAKNIELLRRTGPFQLALLSHLRRDDKIQPVIKAVWQHSLHTSCPNKIAPEEDAIQSVHWRPVAESLLHHVLSSAIHQAEWEPMLSQRHPGEMRTLLMPGSAAAMQILLPQLQSKEGLRDRNFIEVLMDQAVQLAAVLPRCLPATLCNALNAVGQSLSSGKAGDVIGLFGDDVITEMTARACASVQEWPGSATFESVRLHLHVIVRALMRNMARQQADDAGNPIDQQESKRDEYPHMLKALLPAVAAVLLLPLSQQVAALQTQFPTLHTWADCLEALLNPFPLAGTWRTFFERGMQAAFQLHGLDLEDSLCSSADAGEDLQDSLQLLQQLSVAIEDFVITVGCTDASIVRVAAISHMLSSSKGIAPDKAMSILSFMRNKSNVHLLEAVAGLIEVQDIDTAIPLVGVSYALQLLGEESKKDPAALKACLTLMNQAIQRSDNDFQKLHPLKTYLQQISIYLMEHLMSRVGVSTINSWPEAEEIGERVLSESFYALMEEQEAGLTTSATVMHLLEDVLPSTAQGCGWDTPLVACLAAALSTTSQLSLVIANLVKHSLKKKLGNPSKRALQMLEDAFKKTLSILQRRDPQKSQVFVAFVLARELVLHSVDVVETYLETDNEELQQRLEKVLTCIVEALEMQFAGSTRVDADTAMLLCTYEGRDLRVEQLPTAFASLYVVAATRRREAPLPTNTAIKHLLEVVAFIAGGGDSGLHCFLESCRDEMVTLSNALGLSLLLPDQSKVADIKTVVSCLHDLGSEEQSCSQQAAKQFEGLCHEKRDNFQALLQSMRAVGEVACMQCSAEDEETLDLAGRIARELPSVLGPAGVLLRLKADDETPWNIDFLNMDAEKAWQASIFAHLICFLGAAHVSINRRQEDLPPAIKPFVAFNSIDEPTLNSTFWPGVPNDWWQSLRYSGLHKHLLPVTGNIVWGQCQCGYRYCYAECGAPVSAAKCPSPEGEGRCTLMNGGQNHTFAPHQQLIAVVVTAHPHGTGWPPVYSSMSQGFPAAFRPPPPSPGLFALTEADLHISVTEKERAVVSHSLMSETVRQDWNQPLGKPPDPKSGLHPIAFRVLHLLIHASALIGIEMEWVQERDNIVQLLQGHLRQVARMNPVRNANDTVWYFMANVEADLDALAKLLNGTLEVATLFMHAVLHRLGSLQPHEQPSGQTLTSHNARVAYETWFHNTIIQPILGEKGASGDFPLPGVHALRREAGQATDPNLLLKADFLARRGLQTGAWANMKEDVRAALLPHVLRPLVSASIGDTFEELVAASMGGNRFVILRLLMAGVEEESASWRILPDLARAASLAWILPFMQLVRDKEGGKITMREARTTTIRKWLESRAGHEQHHAWITFRNFEAAWNAALASDQLRDGCGVIRLPRITLESPLAMACPIANPEKPQHGDIEVGNLDKPEHIASLGLHHLAVSHNKLIAQVNAYLVASNAIAAHVRARLHPSAGLCQSSGQCQPAAETCHDQSVRLIQKASATDLFVFPSQLEDACAVEDDVHPHGPRTFRLDYKIGTFCQDFFQVPWSADPPARGEHDFEAMESDLAWRLIVGRRPLQICSDLGEEQDHSNLDKDIDAFPYRIFHGSVDVRILNRLKGSRLVQQVSLSEALSVQKAEDLEISFFRDTSHALEVSKITGDLIALLLGVNVAHAFRSDMTLLEFVEVFTLVDKAPHQDRKCENHPDALMRIADLPDVATVPLNALVALHLLSKDMLAMTRGVSIKTRDTGTEYTKSLDLPPQFKDGLDKLKEECPQVLAVVCRLVARTVYLASELPLDHDHRHDKEKFQKAPPLCMLVKQMDILDELAEVGEGKEEQAEELLEMPVPLDLEYWNDWNEGHAIAAVKIYRSLWSEIREPYLAPAKPVLAASNDPAVASGMAKGLATSGWLQPKVGRGRGPRRVKGFKKKDQDESEEDGDWEVIDPIDPTSPVKTRPVKAGRGNKSSAERQRQDQAGATFVGKVHYSGSWADELAAIMADKTAESYSVRTKGGQGSSIPFVAGGQPGELVSTPMSEDFPLIVIPKKAEANPHNPQRPQGLEGLDFMRDVLEKFINQRAGGPDHGRTIEKEDAKQVALAWDDVEMMGEALQPLLMPLGQDVDVTEERGRFVTEFHQHFEQQQNSMPRPIKDHVQPSQLQTCILEAKGWTLRKSPGDGHCQFHSVGFAVGEGHETVRSHALAWITQHREEYKMKMVVERNGTPASFTDTVEDDELESALDKYIARMSEGAWGDNITLHALAHHYQREIRVLTDNVKNAWVQIEPGFGNPIYVAFYAEFHYDSVITETPTL